LRNYARRKVAMAPITTHPPLPHRQHYRLSHHCSRAMLHWRQGSSPLRLDQTLQTSAKSSCRIPVLYNHLDHYQTKISLLLDTLMAGKTLLSLPLASPRCSLNMRLWTSMTMKSPHTNALGLNYLHPCPLNRRALFFLASVVVHH